MIFDIAMVDIGIGQSHSRKFDKSSIDASAGASVNNENANPELPPKFLVLELRLPVQMPHDEFENNANEER